MTVEAAFTELWNLAKTAGPFATMLMLWLLYQERRERQTAQKQTFDLATSGLKALNGVETAIDALRSAMGRRPRRNGRS